MTLLQNQLDGSQSKLTFQNTTFFFSHYQCQPEIDSFTMSLFHLHSSPAQMIPSLSLLSTVLILFGHSDELLCEDVLLVANKQPNGLQI
jgi:hypothetical protein